MSRKKSSPFCRHLYSRRRLIQSRWYHRGWRRVELPFWLSQIGSAGSKTDIRSQQMTSGPAWSLASWRLFMNGPRAWWDFLNNSTHDFLTVLQPFEKLTDLTDVPEGTIVRVINRLDETCREVRDAARVIGDTELMKKMEEAQNKIKRDSKCYLESKESGAQLIPFQSCLQQVCISRRFR